MKFNLKNRPSCFKHGHFKVEEWFEEFEKELREIEKKQSRMFGLQAAFIPIKEILGEK